MWFVHRWTARAIADLAPELACGHARPPGSGSGGWTIPQSREQDIEQLIEARAHLRAAGDTAAAVGLTEPIVRQLQTWGHYGRAAELCRQTLGWVGEATRRPVRCTGIWRGWHSCGATTLSPTPPIARPSASWRQLGMKAALP